MTAVDNKCFSDNNNTGFVQQDPTSHLLLDLIPLLSTIPMELISNILSFISPDPVKPYLDLATLGTFCLVSKKKNELASDPLLWKIAIYRERAFGNSKWAKCFGDEVVKDEDHEEEFLSLPWKDYIEDCKKLESYFLKKKRKIVLCLFGFLRLLMEDLPLTVLVS